MATLRTIILEDNISFVWDYEMILDKLGVKVQAVHKSWTQVLREIKKNPPDFMIVDLFLENNEHGLDFIKEVKNLYIPIIICTGYPENDFLDDAIQNDVFAFLSKPLDKPAFTFEVKKLIKKITDERNSNKILLLKDKGVLIRVPFDHIIKIEIEGNYSYVITSEGKKFVMKMSLKKLLEKLDPSIFQRCHRSTVINLDRILSFDITNSKIEMTNGEWIDIGSKFKNAIKLAFVDRQA